MSAETCAELQARYERVGAEYDVVDRFTDNHPYPSGLDKLMFLSRELDQLRKQLDQLDKT